MEDLPPYALQISPDNALQFTLTRDSSEQGSKSGSTNEGTVRCYMTLKHTGKVNSHIAFKVKTTQPRRYLVRPNQGVVAPNQSETVTIILVEKDKQALLQSFDRLGQGALDHSKDKFLVQSCVVTEDFATKHKLDKPSGENAGKSLAEGLTALWNSASSGSTEIFNKKLPVKHIVGGIDGAAASSSINKRVIDSSGTAKPAPSSAPPQPTSLDMSTLDKMTPDQIMAELKSLRRKYDELVAFSVNLTAERDILSNTLDSTKRDLNREMASRAALENRGGGINSAASGKKEKKGSSSILKFIFISTIFFLIGVKATVENRVGFIEDIPVLGNLVMNTDVTPQNVSSEKTTVENSEL